MFYAVETEKKPFYFFTGECVLCKIDTYIAI